MKKNDYPSISIIAKIWKSKLALFLRATMFFILISLTHVFAVSANPQSTFETQQKKIVSGKVTNALGEPIPGVSIVIKGTTKGTISDPDGNYSLTNVPSDGTLIFSFIGMRPQESIIGTLTQINVKMIESEVGLEEVVVTALGITKEKKSIGFAVQELKQEDLSDARELSAANFLTGKIAGLQISNVASGVGGSTKVTIRGNSSLTGENQPLYVVDGIPLDNTRNNEAGLSGGKDFGDGIGNLNTQDIESLTVLKGPNATALYGSRGSNGVILIKTKTGKAGKGVSVEFNSNTTIDRINLIPTPQNKYGLGYEDMNTEGDMVEINGVNYQTIPFDLNDSWGPPMDGRLYVNPYVFDNTPPTTFHLLPQPVDNIRDFWNTGIVTNNSIALSGGTEKSSARLSFDNVTTKGITPKNSGGQQTVALRAMTKIGDKLSIDAKFNYIHKTIDNAPELGSAPENFVRSLAIMGRSVPLPFLKEYYDKTGKNGSFPGVYINPYYAMNEIKNNSVKERTIAFVSANYQFNSWLSLMARSGVDFSSENRNYRWPVGAPQNSNGRIIQETYQTKESNSDVMLTLSKLNPDYFSFTLSLGAYLLKKDRLREGWDARNFKVPGVYDISNTTDIRPYLMDVKREMQSVYFTSQVGYKNYLFLDITGRNDWSSTLGLNNYSFFYPSANLAFAFTDALAIKSRVLSFGKLRASFAQAGNDSDPYQTLAGFNSYTTPFNGQYYVSQKNTIPLLDLKNELKTSVEFGANLRFFENRISLDATYYNGSTKNQILPINISATSGYSVKIVNAGEIRNKGLELTLNVNPVKLKNSFQWDVSFNYSKNNSEVVSLAPGIETYLLYNSSPNRIEARPGHPYGDIIGTSYKRAPDGQRIVRGGRYVTDTKPKVLGNVSPDWTGGLNNAFSFKGFTLNALIDFVQGNEITSNTKWLNERKGFSAFTEEGREMSRPLDGVVEITDAGGTVTGYAPNTTLVDGQTYWGRSGVGEEFVMDGSYIMLREVILGYTFAPSFTKKTPFKAIRASLVGRNLWYIEEHMQNIGISPETVLNTKGAATGVEVLSMPTTRSYGFNINLTF